MEATIQMIFLLGYAYYDQAHRLPAHIREAAHCIMVCRTALLGGHTQACPDGHYKRHWYNSCKHRMCPLCAFTQIKRWLVKQKARILNTNHFHVIFTIPSEFHELWRLNTKIMTQILFKTSTETLFQLLEDKKYLGARPGIIASLHTWTKILGLHPHLHCLITGGGLIAGEWIKVSQSYLLPFGVVRNLFRGKFIAYIRKALCNGELILPAGMGPQQLKNLLNKLGRKKWNVYLKETYSHGTGVLIYMARYLRGGPISNKRIISIKDGKVTFNYGREKVELITMTLLEFIVRYLQHVPLPGSIRVRSYGLYHHSHKEKLELCRQLFGQQPVEEPEFLDWQTLCEQQGEKHPECCPICGKRLIVLGVIPGLKRSRAPSLSYDHDKALPLAA